MMDLVEREAEALDAYSRIVVSIAARLAPSVANSNRNDTAGIAPHAVR